MPLCRLGPPAWSFAVDAHDCIMVLPHEGRPNTRLRAVIARKRAPPLIVIAAAAAGLVGPVLAGVSPVGERRIVNKPGASPCVHHYRDQTAQGEETGFEVLKLKRPNWVSLSLTYGEGIA